MLCDGLGKAVENVVLSVRGLRYTQVEGTVCGTLISPGLGGYLWPPSQKLTLG